LTIQDDSGATPTVVVARRVIAGQEENFRDWDRRIRAAAGPFPGYLGSDVQPPDDSHPGEWVTVYSFASAAELDEWLSSEERAALIAESDRFVEGPIREQRVAALRTAPDPVTVVWSQRIARQNHDAFVALHDDVLGRLQTVEGFLASDLLPPVDGIQDDYVIVSAFASRAALDGWLVSEDRRAWVEQIEHLVEGERTMNVVGGFGGWFPALPTRPEGPKRWKQSIAVLIALFPTTLTISLIRGEIAPNMNVVVSVFIGNVLGVIALSYVLMPRVTRWLGAWLNR